MQIFQRTEQRFKKIIAWLLIIVLMVPNVAFGAELGHEVLIRVLLPDGNIAESGSMTHVTLSVYADNEGTPGERVTTFNLTDTWQIDLNNQPELQATKYWLKASAEGENYFLLDSLTIPIDLGNVTGPIDAELKLSSPVLKGTVYMPDGVTPVSDDVNVIISGPGETQISGGVYTFDVWRLGQTVSLPLYADVTEDGLLDSDPIMLTPSMFDGGVYLHNFVLKEGTSILKINVKAPDGETDYHEFRTHYHYNSPGAKLYTSRVNNQLIVDSGEDGDYEIYFNSNGIDSYAYNSPFLFSITDGKAYQNGVQISNTVDVSLREGVVGAYIKDLDLNPMTTAVIEIFEKDTNGIYNMATMLYPKSDGSLFIPKVDGDYKLKVWRMNPDLGYAKEKYVTVLNGEIVGEAGNFEVYPTQIKGEVLSTDLSPIQSTHFDVIIRNTVTNEHFLANNFTEDYNQVYYGIGALPDGSYEIYAEPFHDLLELYSRSNKLSFEIVDGQSNILDHNLVLNDKSSPPVGDFILYKNYVKNFPLSTTELNVQVEFSGFSGLSSSDFEVALYDFDENTNQYTFNRLLTQVNDSPFEFYNTSGDLYMFSGYYDISGIELINTIPIYVGIKDKVSNQIIYAKMRPSDKPIIDYARLLQFVENNEPGATHDIYYHAVSISDNVYGTHEVTVRDNSFAVIGSGYVERINDRFYDYIMRTEVPKGSDSALYWIPTMTFKNDDSILFDKSNQTHMFLWNVYTNNTHHVVEFYNSQLTVDNITKLDFVSHSLGKVLGLENTTKYEVEQFESDGLMPAGVRFVIPVENIPSVYDYDIQYQTPQTSGSRGTFDFTNPNESLLEVKVMDPTGETQLTNIAYSHHPYHLNPPSNFEIKDGVFRLINGFDGDYWFTFSSKDQDDYAVSKPLYIKIHNGFAYADQDMQIPYGDFTSVNLQEGIYMSKIVDEYGNPINWAIFAAFKNTETPTMDESFISTLKPDGSIYLPKIDGEYSVQSSQGDKEGNYWGDEISVVVNGSTIENAVDLKLSKEQFRGTVLNIDGSSFGNWGFDVRVMDIDDNVIDASPHMIYTSDGVNRHFAFIGLPQGMYYVQTIPTGENALTLGPSAIYPIMIDADGNADIEQFDLRFTEKVDLPLQITQNNRPFIKTDAELLSIDLFLQGVDATSPDEISVELYEGPVADMQLIKELTNIAFGNKYLDPIGENEHQFWAEYWIDDITLDPAKVYTLVFKGFTKDEEVFAPLVVTSNPIIGDISYIGRDDKDTVDSSDDTYNHILWIDNANSDQYAATLYDEFDTPIGTAEVKRSGQDFSEFIMTSSVIPGETPVRYDISGTVFANNYVKTFTLDQQDYRFIYDINTTSTHHEIKIYNESLIANGINNFAIFYHDENRNEIKVFDTTQSSDYTKSQLTDWVGGEMFTIPVSAFPGNEWYSIRFETDFSNIGIGPFFFEDPAQTVVAFKVIDPATSMPIKAPGVHTLVPSFENHFDTMHANDKIIVTAIDDGEYGISFDGGQSHPSMSLSNMFKFKIVDGKAYTVEETPKLITETIIIPLNTGIPFGVLENVDGTINTDESARVRVERVISDEQTEWMGTLFPNTAGMINVPLVDGSFRLYVESDNQNAIGEIADYSITNGIITGTKELRLYPVQVSGKVMMDETTPVTEPHFGVELTNTADSSTEWIFPETNANGEFTFKLGKLPEGSYTLKAIPFYEFRQLGYIDSEPVAFTIGVDGLATPSNINLTFIHSPRDAASLEALITIAEGIDVTGMTEETILSFIEALNHARTYPEMNHQSEYDAEYTALDAAIKALKIIKPALSVNNTDPTNQDVLITANYGFTHTDTGYVPMFKIGETGTWMPFGTGIVAEVNATFFVKMTYAHEGYTFETAAEPMVIGNIDKTAPTITLTGDADMTLARGTAYDEPGFTVSDNASATENIETSVTGTVETNTPGTYVLTYTATDEAGNVSTKTRTINVADQSMPVITITKQDGTTVLPATLKVIGTELLFKMEATDDVDGTDLIVTVTMNDAPITAEAGLFTAPLVAGANLVKVTAEDKSGNISEKSITIENASLTLEASITAPTNQEVTVTATAPADLTEAATITDGGTQTVSENGTVSFSAHIEGLTTPKAFTLDVANIDTAPPAAPVLTASTTEPTNANITLTLTGEEILEFKIGTGEWTAYTGPIEITENTAVYSRAKDVAGNTTEGNTITVTWIDKTAPSITTALTDQTVNRSAFSFTASADDTQGAATLIIKQNGSAITAASGETYNATLTVGNNTFVLEATDEAGNVTTKIFTVAFVKLPTEKPVITPSTLEPTNQPIEVVITYPADAEEMLYAIGTEDNWMPYDGPIYVVEPEVTLYAKAKQNADSLDSEIVTLTLTNFDITKPELPFVAPSNTDPTNQDITVTITGDGDSDIYYKVGEAFEDTAELSSLTLYTGEITLTENASVYAMAVDAAGNRSSVATLTVTNIDKVPPTATITYSTTAPTRNSVYASISVNEDYEMASGEQRYHEFTANGTHTFNFKDMAGNTSSITATVSNIDKTAPVIAESAATVGGIKPSAVKGGDTIIISATATDVNAVTAKASLGALIVDQSLTVTPTGTPNQYTVSGTIVTPSDFDGSANLVLSVIDAVGNRTNLTLISGLVIDNTKPVFNVAITNTPLNGFIVDQTIATSVTTDGSTLKFGASEASIDQEIATLDAYIAALDKNGETHTLYFRATDAVGNISDVKALTFKWDATAPVTPAITIAETSPTNKRTVTMTGVAEAGTVTVRRVLSETAAELIYQGSTAGFLAGVPVQLRNGENTFTIVNRDAAGNASQPGTFKITYDGQAPIIDMFIEENGTIVAKTNETLTDITYTIDGVEQATPVFVGDTATLPAIETEGEHFLIFTGKDAAGNIGTGRLSIIIVLKDNGARELSEGVDMAQGSFTESGELTLRTFEVSAGDENSFIGEPLDFHLSDDITVDPEKGVVVLLNIGTCFPANTKLHFYDEANTEWVALDESVAHGDSYYNATGETVKVSIHSGLEVADSVVVDPAGTIDVAPGTLIGFMRHFSGYAAIQDVTPPTVQINTAEPTLPVNASTYSIGITVSETSILTVGGVAESTPKAAGTYQYNMTLVEGMNQFTIYATDLAGLVSSTEVLTVVKDSSFESLSANLGAVADGSKVRNKNLVVNATADDANFKRITINGTPFTNKNVSTTVTLVEGANAITVTAEDTAGNTKTQTFTVTLDTVAPAIQITGVSEGDIVSGNISAAITGDADLHTYTWTLTSTGVNQTGTKTNVSYNTPAGTKDIFTLIVDAYDSVGNMTRETLTFNVDTAAPVITNGAFEALSKNNQNISITVSPVTADVEVNIYKDGIRVMNAGIVETENAGAGTKSYSFTASAEGSYSVSVSAINGPSVASKTLNFVIDKTAPVISITGVEDGQTYTTKPSIAFSATSSATTTATLTKSGAAAQTIGSGYEVAANGTYTLLVTSTDAAGNTATQTLSFTVNVPTTPVNPGGGTPGGTPGGGTTVPPVVPVPPVTPPTSSADVEKVLTAAEVAKMNSITVEGAVTLAFDAKATDRLKTGGEVAITATKVDVTTLPKAAQTLIGSRPVYAFEATVAGKAVHSFGSGTVKVSIPYTLAAGEDANAIVVYYIDANGKIVPMISKYEGGKVTFITNHFSTYAVGYNKVTFTDVPSSEWFASAVAFMSSKNLINGKGANLFAPKAHITRAEIVAILANMAGVDLSAYKTSTFTDVKNSDWYMPAIQWATSIGLANGQTSKTFGPNAPISRQDLAVMIHNYARLVAGYEMPKNTALNAYADDRDITSYARPSIIAMQRAGFMSGKPGNTFDPKGKATRAEVAKILELMLKEMTK